MDELRICVVIVLVPAGPTREAHLRALQMLQATETDSKKSVDIRVLPMNRCYGDDCERIIFPPTVIQAHNSGSGHTILSIGSTGDAGHDEAAFGSFNAVFQPDDNLRDQWRRWFQFIFQSAATLTEVTVKIPHLIPPKGQPEAAEAWTAFLTACGGQVGQIM